MQPRVVHPILGEFEIVKPIGSGSFATVYLARHCEKRFPVALKVFDVNFPIDGTIPSFKMAAQIEHPFICREFDFFENIAFNPKMNSQNIKTSDESTNNLTNNSQSASTDHFTQNIINISEFDQNAKQMCILMEYVNGITLLEYANNFGPLNEIEIQKIAGQLVIALEVLHSRNIIHRDLKCENILIDSYGNVRLIDFGFSCESSHLHSTTCGSPAYIAPEIILKENYTNSVDVWSLGIVLYAISYGYLPFEDQSLSKLLQMIVNEEPSFEGDDDVSDNLGDLIRKMLIKDPKERITLEQIKNHPFFTQDAHGRRYEFESAAIEIMAGRGIGAVLGKEGKDKLRDEVIMKLEILPQRKDDLIKELDQGDVFYKVNEHSQIDSTENFIEIESDEKHFRVSAASREALLYRILRKSLLTSYVSGFGRCFIRPTPTNNTPRRNTYDGSPYQNHPSAAKTFVQLPPMMAFSARAQVSAEDDDDMPTVLPSFISNYSTQRTTLKSSSNDFKLKRPPLNLNIGSGLNESLFRTPQRLQHRDIVSVCIPQVVPITVISSRRNPKYMNTPAGKPLSSLSPLTGKLLCKPRPAMTIV
ncbi:hypothetical protein TRFO_35592 [Tritrichomonas foetus]|uniref:non-specific serine/threonine protein kinase n=1 Tax=Tritrichomonas foetus TaxID=1144522 RepID=A0A1J4JFR7_9EUKA|nr:hypothetical protein TRFO_35592 [Tritrichomonas foetus]|eukprot:OHS98062.1 hypothetical protein TRFO_35592 [Tritrichomonas foetus]